MPVGVLEKEFLRNQTAEISLFSKREKISQKRSSPEDRL
jgi:hypothetical protein